jgi:hypothetical protein
MIGAALDQPGVASPPDEVLMRRISRRRHDALAELYGRHSKRLRATIDGVVHEIFTDTRIHHAPDCEFKGMQSNMTLLPWLYLPPLSSWMQTNSMFCVGWINLDHGVRWMTNATVWFAGRLLPASKFKYTVAHAVTVH